MLFNCFCCGKLISLKKDLCPYCMVDVNEARSVIESEVTAKERKSRLKHTFFSLLSR